MRLNQPFLQLPISFCAKTLAEEVRALPSSAWMPHPTGFVGNEAVPLVTPEGAMTDDFEGPMAPTPPLLRCPYIMEIMAELGCVWGRSRLMGLAAGRDVPPHVDSHYYWRTHHRIHIPVITNPGVSFSCGPETVHMAEGECWMFDNFRWHTVQNNGTEQRVHLVLDTVGGERLHELVEAARAGEAPDSRTLVPGQRSSGGLDFEQVNAPTIMSPWEISSHIDFITEFVVPDPALDKVSKRLAKFVDAWIAAWARFGTDEQGLPTYRRLMGKARQDLHALGGNHLMLRNKLTMYEMLDQLIFVVAAPLREADLHGSATAAEQRLAS